MGGGYEEIGSAKDITNVNPMTGGFAQGLQGQQSNLWGMLQGMTPAAMMQGLGGQATGLSDIASQLMGAYTSASNASAMAQARENVRGTLNEFSMGNALHSGAAGIGTERAASLPWLEALTNQSNLQAQLAGGFGTQYLGASQNQYSNLASLFGQGQGIQGQLAMPSWYEPTYGYKQGFMDYAAPILGSAAGGFAGGAASQLFKPKGVA